MDVLILIGIVILVAVLFVDCLVRLAIVWNMRKRRRAVKPLGAGDAPERDVNARRGDEHGNGHGHEHEHEHDNDHDDSAEENGGGVRDQYNERHRRGALEV